MRRKARDIFGAAKPGAGIEQRGGARRDRISKRVPEIACPGKPPNHRTEKAVTGTDCAYGRDRDRRRMQNFIPCHQHGAAMAQSQSNNRNPPRHHEAPGRFFPLFRIGQLACRRAHPAHADSV